MMRLPVIEIKHLKKSFDDKEVLKDVNLLCDEGKSTVIVGRSGCGKSVLLKSIIGLIRPEAGEILVDGENIIGMKKNDLFRVRRKFGMLFQGAALFDSLTVAGNVALPLVEHTRLSEEEIRGRVKSKLSMVDLAGAEDKMTSELSGGMRKRVGLARALIMDPKFILYDEPTTGLDPITSAAIDALIRETQARLGLTSIIVTHKMDSAFHVGDSIAMLEGGRIIFSGSIDEFKKSEKKEIRAFCGKTELKAGDER